MTNQIFISYRRTGGDVTAKLICETLKNRGYSVFYDYETLKGGYFDTRILEAIEDCRDFVLVLPPHALDRCTDEDDWVRNEIRHALRCGKDINIIPVILPGFEFPKDLPADIAPVTRYNGVRFAMDYFDAVIDKIEEKLTCKKSKTIVASRFSEGLKFRLTNGLAYYKVVGTGHCHDKDIVIPATHRGKPVTAIGKNAFSYNDYIKSVTIPNCTTTIEEFAFWKCGALEDIFLPNCISIINKCAFYGCTALNSITIPRSVTAINFGIFMECESLEHVVLPENIIKIDDDAFCGCKSLNAIEYNNTKNAWKAIHLSSFWADDCPIKFIHCTDGDILL